MMEFDLETEQRTLVEAAREVATSYLWDSARAREDAHAIDPEVITALGDRGLLGVNIPRRYGGAEQGVVAYAMAIAEIAAADASVAVTMAVTNMVGEVLCQFGAPEQVARYVPRLTKGEFFGGAFGLSEPGAGSDAASLRTRAEPAGEGWRITGEKMWITTGDQAGVIVVWARTPTAQTTSARPTPSHRDITCFLVEKGAPGLTAGTPEDKMGLRASHTVPLALAEVEVPREAILGQEGDGFRIAMTALDGGRIGIGAQAVGIGRRALGEATQWAKGLGTTPPQHVQFALADMATELDAAWLMVLRAATLKEQKRAFSREAAMAKVMASETANRVIRRALHMMGPEGYTDSQSVMSRLLRDCRVTQIYEGTSEIQRLVIARHVLRG